MADRALIRLFARQHGCPPGCPDCAEAELQCASPELLADWDAFVSSKDAYRLVLLCDRAGKPLPVFTLDDVVQFCIEEALYERLTFVKASERYSEAFDPSEDPESVSGVSTREHADALEKARLFALSQGAVV